MKKWFKLSLFVCTIALCLLQAVPASAATPKISAKKISLIPGETYRLSVKNTTAKVKWKSNLRKVAKVSSSGKVTAVKPGKAVITATVGSKKYTCTVTVQETVDIIVFAGQSNMTGVGDASQAPALTQGAGYAFNYVTDRNNLSPIKEPFGLGQDDNYFYNGDYCKGSMVTAFVNAYYKQTKTPVIAVPASAQGTGSVSWADMRYKGIIRRLNAAKKLVRKKGMKVGHVYLVWMQGENDACADMSSSWHKKNLKTIFNNVRKKSYIEQCLVIGIANYQKGGPWASDFKRIQKAQKSLCNSNKNFTMISTKAASLPASYFREDGIHILQPGLNAIGTHAGKNAGKYANSH